MNEVLINTLEKIQRIFMRFGIKSVTMDDIARELGVSKKTLYQHFTDKNDIVKKIVLFNLEAQEGQCRMIYNNSSNAIDCMLGISEMLSKMYSSMTSSVLYDLKKYHAEVFSIIDVFKSDFVRKQLIDNIESGKKSGLYRTDIDTEVVTGLYLCMSDSLANTDYFPPDKISYPVLVREQIMYHLNAITTEKGKKYLTEKLNLTI